MYKQSELARAEANYICNNDNQYIVPTSGNPVRGLIQDHVASGVKLTCKDTFLNKEQFMQLVYVSVSGLPGVEIITPADQIYIPCPAILKPKPLWTGKQVVSCLLNHLIREPQPPLHLDAKTKTPSTAFGAEEMEHLVVFRFNELLCGLIDKSAIGNASMGIVHVVYELYGSELCGLFLNGLGRLLTFHLQNSGQSCGIEDLLLTDAAEKERLKLLCKVKEDAESGLLDFLGRGGTGGAGHSCEESVAEMLSSQRVENKVKLDGLMQSLVNKSASEVIKACLPHGLQIRFPINDFSVMVLTGAKGSAVNQSQISCFLGQQALEGQRVPLMISGKTLPSFKPYDCTIRAGGFITDRFLTGIKPQEFYFHCMAGREGLVDTAVKTSRSGYLQRCLMKHLEELTVQYDMTVRDSDNNVVQFLYGEDGLDTVSANTLRLDSSNVAFMARNYHVYTYKYSLFDGYLDQGFDVDSTTAYADRMRRAKVLCSAAVSDAPKVKKRSVVLAKRKIRPHVEWSRANLMKAWHVAEVVKVRTTAAGRPLYDLKYVSDDVIEKRVPLRMRIRSKLNVYEQDVDYISKDGYVVLIKPGLPDPPMSVLGLDRCLGACSEKVLDGLEDYIKVNPDSLLGVNGDEGAEPSALEGEVSAESLRLLMWVKYMRSLANPGEAVGCVAAQSLGEPSTQMTLNTFHLAGHGGANVTLGIPRLREILM